MSDQIDLTHHEEGMTPGLLLGAVFTRYQDKTMSVTGYDIRGDRQEESITWLEAEDVVALREWLNVKEF